VKWWVGTDELTFNMLAISGGLYIHIHELTKQRCTVRHQAATLSQGKRNSAYQIHASLTTDLHMRKKREIKYL
jgi:hypothetical protein